MMSNMFFLFGRARRLQEQYYETVFQQSTLPDTPQEAQQEQKDNQ